MKKKGLFFLVMTLAAVALLLSSCSNAPKSIEEIIKSVQPSPANGETISSSSVTLQWKVSVPESLEVTYSLYFAPNGESLTLMATGLTKQSYVVKGLELGKAYSWKIVARDNKGHVVNGPLWQFVYRKTIKQTKANTVVEDTYGSIVSLDPAWIYDSRSGEAIYQLYDNLIQYKGTSTAKLLPMISLNVPSVQDNTIRDNGKTYVFHIRKNVRFHNGDLLTPEDVVYSLERVLILDREGGPSWMLAEAMFPKISNEYVDSIESWATKLAGVKRYKDMFINRDTPKNAKYKQALIETFNLISKNFEIKGNDVIIHLPQTYAPFLSLLSHGSNVGAIIDKKWAVSHGAWPGTADTWWKYHNPSFEKDPLRFVENGSGPFFLKKWDKGKEIVFERFDRYWNGPAKIGYGIIRGIQAFTTRKLDLMQGNADIIQLPSSYIDQLKGMNNVKIIKNPSLLITAMAFVWNVNSNAYIGSGKLDGNGIPPDFFSNIYVRKAFEYLFPYKVYVDKVLNGLATIPNGVIPKGMLGYDPKYPPTYSQNLEKATEYFKKAYNGELWEKGFKFTLAYNEGSSQRRTVDAMIRAFAKKVNPKFKISLIGMKWSDYLNACNKGVLPMFVASWMADYTDPYDFVQPFYSTKGAYGNALGKNYVSWAKQHMDPLISETMGTADRTKLSELYRRMNEMAYENALYIWISQPFGIFAQRSNIKGAYYNPAFSGIDFYHISK